MCASLKSKTLGSLRKDLEKILGVLKDPCKQKYKN